MNIRSLLGLGFSVAALGVALGTAACDSDDDPAAGAGSGGNAGTAGTSAGASGADVGAAGAGTGGAAGAAAGQGGAGAAGGTESGAGAGGGGGGGGNGAGDGGAAGQAGSGAAGAAASSLFGLIAISQTVTEFVPGSKITSYSAVADFTKPTDAAPTESPCVVSMEAEGTCQLVACSVDDPSGGAGSGGAAGGAGAPTYLHESAGDITIGGLLAPITLTPKADGSGYAPAFAQMAAWDGTQTAQIAAVGDVIPAFSTSVATPTSITFTKPVAGAVGTALAVKRTEDFVVAWDQATNATVKVSFTSVKKVGGKQDSTTMSCRFDGSTLSATIPATTMGKLVDGTGSILVASGTAGKVAAGEYEVNVELTNNGLVTTASFE
jgi:hypothetical protein